MATAAKLPEIETLRWSGRVPRFARLREGGPGKPSTLAVCFCVVFAIGLRGTRVINQRGIDSIGPPMVFIAAGLACSLCFWLLIKVALRSLEVTFLIDNKGVQIIPSQKQRTLDRHMRILSLVGFWLTLKGGQWSRWHPLTPWKQIRSVEIDEINQEIRIQGGAWDIRLVDIGDQFEAVCRTIRENAPTRTRMVHIGTNGSRSPGAQSRC